MNRRTFIENSCLTCLAVTVGSTLLQSCNTIKTVNAFEENGKLIVEKSEFTNQETKEEYNSLIVTSNYLRTPIILFKQGNGNYDAYSLECTHKKVRLDLVGNKLECSAHGSTFDKEGKVLTGPAKKDLKKYSIDKTATTIIIGLQ